MGDVNGVVKEISKEYAEDEYRKQPQLYERYVNEYEEEIRIKNNNLSKELVKQRAIEKVKNDIAVAKQKQINHNIKINFGVSKAFNLNRYDDEDIREFLSFYEKEVLHSKENLFRDDRAIGGETPNIRVASYSRKHDLRHDFEKYYDYIIDYRNSKANDNEKVLGFLYSKKGINAIWLYILGEINGIANTIKSPVDVWKKGLFCLKGTMAELELLVLERYSRKYYENYYEYYSVCRIIEDSLLGLITRVMQDSNGERELINYIGTSMQTVLKCMDGLLGVKIIEEDVNDIFQDYAIEFYLNATEREIEVIDIILRKLYELTQERKVKGSKRITNAHRLKAKEYGKWLREYMGVNVDIEDSEQLEAIIDEIYFCDREVTLSVDDKNKKYMMPNTVNKILSEGKIRGEGTIILHQKIVRAIDCNKYGKEYYLSKNQLYRSVYEIEKEILRKRNSDENYIKNMPYYWWKVLDMLWKI